MISSVVVNRYANALADVIVAPESGVKPSDAIQQLRAFDSTVEGSRDLRAVLASPAIPVARKRAIIKDIAERLGLARVVRNFILVLSDHRRAAGLAQVVDAFELLLDERLGFVRAEVTSASRLNTLQQSELSEQLGKLAGAQVRMRFEVDPELIGGVTAKIGSRVYDGSVRGQLESMRRRLAAGHHN
ncbi:MAG TPA: ATP synthase F1 subunit delta [Bryobacteraceae bacterium]|jgi:F-type H+-transporting ATPase subunit delta|nr:ATP synthase F1 subunit delta [Bryobacteraceae bacterium]